MSLWLFIILILMLVALLLLAYLDYKGYTCTPPSSRWGLSRELHLKSALQETPELYKQQIFLLL